MILAYHKIWQLLGGLVCLVCLMVLYFVMFSDNPGSLLYSSPIKSREVKSRSNLPAHLPLPTSCTCSPGSVLLKNHIPEAEYEEVKQRRAKEYREWKLRTTTVLSKLLYAMPNSPLHYPSQGFIVKPLTPTVIPGLGLFPGERSEYKVSLKVTKGVLTTDTSIEGATVTGNGESELIIESSNLDIVNDLLAKVSYASSIYHINTGDLLTYQFENHEAVFAIAIQQHKMPVLRDFGKDINSQVTVVTKVFLRYKKVRRMVESIRKFYPEITIIIADDSFNPEKITGENVEHYLMPPGKGLFAGRYVGVSQVTTKYYMWLDGDFLFTKNTKIEKFVEVLEANPELDVVAGKVKSNLYQFRLRYEEGDYMEGGCMDRRTSERYHSIPGYPNCFLTDGTVNFYVGRTDSSLKVGFDPNLKRVAHSQFFMDGLGYLMVASCDDPESMFVEHQSVLDNSALYISFRRPGQADADIRHQIHYFKNNLKCTLYDIVSKTKPQPQD